ELSGSDLKPDALAARLAELAGEHMERPPREALTRLLLQVEEQSQQPVAQEDPGAWARQTVHKVRDWLGSGVAVPGVNAIQQRGSQLTRALEAAAAQLAAEWDAKLGEGALALMEHSGRRLAVAEAALGRFIHFCDDASQAHQSVLKKLVAASQ